MRVRKSITSIVSITIFTLILFSPGIVRGQIGNVQTLLQAGKEDANLLVREYLYPLASGLGADFNSGWNVSGAPIHPLGFQLQLRASVAQVPTAAQSFNISNLDLQTLQLDDDGNQPTSGVTPTISGDSEAGPPVEIEETFTLPNGQTETVDVVEFNMPQGLGVSFIPAPMVQANVGLPMNLEIAGRYIPETPLTLPVLGDKEFGTVQMMGVMAKHGINDYIPGGKILPVNLAIMAGYNSLELSSNLDLNAQTGPNTAPDPDYTGGYDNQRVSAKLNTFTVNVLAGKKLPIIKVYGGLGYETSTMNVDVAGAYPIVVPNPEYPQNSSKQKRIDTIQDPISYSQKGANNIHAIVGGTVSLLIFKISAEATIAEYTAYSVGVGIGI